MNATPRLLLSAALLLATVPALAASPTPQYNQYNNGYSNNSHEHRDFDRGLRDGARGGSYYDQRHASDGYDDRYRQSQNYYHQDRQGYYAHHGDVRYYNQDRGGIGPGKGALIGGAGGAVLGTLFGGGLKGAIIGGAAGAGIGAVVGESNQDHRDDRRRNDGYYGR